MHFSAGAELALHMLTEAGHAAYLVGGAVRDFFLRRPPHDYDIATSATPEEICALFARTVDTGARYGSITALIEGEQVEITTFRTDGVYVDSRRPETVRFTSDIREDLKRRDFTVCAMALSPRMELIDPTGGLADLEAQVIRTVGDPARRFEEDALRILRALRLSSELNFEIDSATLHAALEKRHLLREISAERTTSELLRLLTGRGAERVILLAYPILDVILPGLARLAGFQMKNPAHAYDMLTHTAKSVSFGPSDPTVRLALLLHDIGKPDCFSVDADGVGHAFGHEIRGAELLEELLPKLRLPKREMVRVLRLVRDHQFPFPEDAVELNLLLAQLGPQHLRNLLELRAADVFALRPGMGPAAERALCLAEAVETLAETGLYREQDLALSGAELDFLPPERIGTVLHQLLEEVIRGELKNEHDPLLARAKAL